MTPLQCSHLRAPGDMARPTSCLFRILKAQTGCGCLQPQKPCFCDACRCLHMPAARETLTMSMPTDACRCLQLAKPSHCRCLRMPADACSSQTPHTVNACSCLQMHTAPKTRTLPMPADACSSRMCVLNCMQLHPLRIKNVQASARYKRQDGTRKRLASLFRVRVDGYAFF